MWLVQEMVGMLGPRPDGRGIWDKWGREALAGKALDSQQGVWALPVGNGKLVEYILNKGGSMNMMFKDTGGISSGTCKLLPSSKPVCHLFSELKLSLEHSGTHLCVYCAQLPSSPQRPSWAVAVRTTGPWLQSQMYSFTLWPATEKSLMPPVNQGFSTSKLSTFCCRGCPVGCKMLQNVLTQP